MTKDEALKLALEAFGEIDWSNNSQWQSDRAKVAIATLKKAMAQPEQEPVAWMNDSTPSGIFARHTEGAKNFGCTIPLYTTPPQRTWTGLTDEEVDQFHNWKDCTWSTNELVRHVEAKLKDKNAGR